MGRRKDDPQLQAAKGYPSRRKSKVNKELDALSQAAEISGTVQDPFPLPDLFKRAPAHWAQAIKLWHELSEILLKQGRRRPSYRAALARYCWWTQQFFDHADQLRRDLPKGGSAIRVKKGDGEIVIRTHPNIEFMAKAETQLRMLDADFGFTPQRDADLIRVESFNAGQGKFNFNNPASSAQQPAAATSDPMDLMNETDSAPPDARLN